MTLDLSKAEENGHADGLGKIAYRQLEGCCRGKAEPELLEKVVHVTRNLEASLPKGQHICRNPSFS